MFYPVIHTNSNYIKLVSRTMYIFLTFFKNYQEASAEISLSLVIMVPDADFGLHYFDRYFHSKIHL